MKAESLSLEGTFFIKGEFIEGTYDRVTCNFYQGEGNGKKALFLPLPVNAHTHLGDSFITQEPKGTLEEIVGPGGFKLSMLSETSENTIINGIKKSINYMKRIGTGSFIDFRETGYSGINTLEALRKSQENCIIMGRPKNVDDLKKISNIIDGVGFSALSDDNVAEMKIIAKEAKKNKLLVSTHYSEKKYEPMELLNEINPDFLIHCTALKSNQLDDLSKITKNVVVTPRSNLFYGIRPDYSKFIRSDFSLMLGTDNVMTVNPNIFEEMDFLYRYQRNVNRIEPEKIMEMAFCNSINPQKGKVKRSWFTFQGKIPTPFQIVTKFSYLNAKKIVEIEL
jgi:cytosine/adenosine deaminase-related metal-dependent hydrolase